MCLGVWGLANVGGSGTFEHLGPVGSALVSDWDADCMPRFAKALRFKGFRVYIVP